MPNKKKYTESTGVIFLLLTACLLALIMVLTGITHLHRPDSANAGEINANVESLKAVELLPLPDLNAAARERKKRELVERGGSWIEDENAERASILGLTDADKGELLRRFRGAAICGDSIADDIVSYGWLDRTIVFSKIGVRIDADTEVVKRAVQAKPSVMFLVFGINDIGTYGEKSDVFITRYTSAIRQIQTELPDTVIYVHAVFPPKEITKKTEYYQYRDDYNAGLRTMCDDLGVFFIDGSFILEAMPELYEPDLVHVKRAFYPMWLSYLADVAGLNGETA